MRGMHPLLVLNASHLLFVVFLPTLQHYNHAIAHGTLD